MLMLVVVALVSTKLLIISLILALQVKTLSHLLKNHTNQNELIIRLRL